MRLISLIILIIFALTSCASKKNQAIVRDEIAREPVVKTDKDLYTMEDEMLTKNTNLSEEQKEKLHHLFAKNKTQNESLDNEIRKTKSVLFKSLISEDRNKVKVNTLESQLMKLNRKKTRYSLDAYREAKSIVGKDMESLDRSFRMIDYNKSLESL